MLRAESCRVFRKARWSIFIIFCVAGMARHSCSDFHSDSPLFLFNAHNFLHQSEWRCPTILILSFDVYRVPVGVHTFCRENSSTELEVLLLKYGMESGNSSNAFQPKNAASQRAPSRHSPITTKKMPQNQLHDPNLKCRASKSIFETSPIRSCQKINCLIATVVHLDI